MIHRYGDIDANCIESPTRGREVVLTLFGMTASLGVGEVDALTTALHAAMKRLLDPTPLPEAEPLPSLPPRRSRSAAGAAKRPSHPPTLAELKGLLDE